MTLRTVLLLLLVLSGCSRELEQGQLPGSYEMTLDGMRQVIVVGADGRYTNTCYKDGAVDWPDRNAWEYERFAGERGVTFNGFRFYVPLSSFETSSLAVDRRACTFAGHCFNKKCRSDII